MKSRKWLPWLAFIGLGIATYTGWQYSQSDDVPAGFARSNGRIEAVEIDVATKTAGRLVDMLVREGDFVSAGQVLARMDTDVLEAQRMEAEAQLRRAEAAVETARSTVAQRESEKEASESGVAQREAELDLAQKNFARVEPLFQRGATTAEEFDTARATLFGAEAAVARAKADVAAADAAIATAKSQVIQAEAAVVAAEATIRRLKTEINDSTLRSPRDGRVQFRIAQPGEVLNAGGKVVNLVDLADVYMTFFLPTAEAGRIRIGTEARLILDAAPHLIVPAEVTFVADVAQFTPKTVETAEERQKLMFRVKAAIAPELLRQHIQSVKTGLPGVAYVQIDPQVSWPEHLAIRLPE